jgi:Flp pilus assembly protein TadG
MKMPSSTPLMARRGDPRGQVLVLFALMLVVLLLVSALAVDYGGWLVTKRNYQNVSDAASLAGAQQLTRSITTNKQQLAREAAWQSVKAALNFGAGLDPAAQATTSSSANGYYTESGYKVWVASPPADAGSAYVGHVSGPGVVYVRIDHAGMDYLSRIVDTKRTVSAWSTAGRFPANFAVIGMCSPTSITTNCLAGDANIKLDGTNTNLIINTGDLGTNRWARDGGVSSGVALGADSNAYMQLFDTCWAKSTNQCQLWGYDGTNVDTSTTRAAIPLGAPIPDPNYAAPTINSTTAPNECRGAGTVQLASAQVLERPAADPGQVSDLPIKLASAIQPAVPGRIMDAAVKISGTVSSGGVPVYVGVTVDLVNATTNVVSKTTTTNGSGAYNFTGVNNSPPNYYLRVTDSTATQEYATTSTASVSYTADTTVNISVSKNPLVTGTVRSAATSAVISGATVTISALGTNYTATTNGSGVYSRYIPAFGNTVAYGLVASATGYVDGSALIPVPTAVDQTYTQNFSLTPAPASLTGTITDAVTLLPVPGITVTLGSGGSATTNSSGVYNIASALVGTTTITLSGTATSTGTTMDGYAYSTPTSGSNITINAGANTRNFTLWPKGCYDGGSSRNFGSWSCDWPSAGNCPATINLNAANVSCTFTQANAIRPGTYTDITIPSNTCAWIDPKGGVTGLATGQMAGIVHVKGTISMGNNAYLFGDGVTIVMDQGSNFDVNIGGGFVLNYGTIKTSGTATCDPSTDFSTPKAYNDGTTPCFRTVSPNDGQDYAYAAWTTAGYSPWQTNSGSGCVQASPPTYFTKDTNLLDTITPCVTPGKDLGITFYMYKSGLGNASRMKLSTANMGYLFNGVLYAPNDDIQLGGGKDGQSAAGQIVGWTIEYHGGTRILQNWYGDPVDGQPFLIEPVLGE